MKKEAYYFSHDSNARHDPKILAMRSVYGAEGYGWFWMLIEILREQPEHKFRISGKYDINALAMQLQCERSAIEKFLHDCINEFELFRSDGEYFWSESLLRRMEEYHSKSEKARLAALKKWSKANENKEECDSNADAMQTHNEGNALKENKIKENKENEIKERKGESREGNPNMSGYFHKGIGRELTVAEYSFMSMIPQYRDLICKIEDTS